MYLLLADITATILVPAAPSTRQRLAASELQRGLAQLGCPATVTVGEWGGAASGLRCVLTSSPGAAETYTIRTSQGDNGTELALHGDSEQALLYAVFDLLERQGALFGIDGDVYPVTPPDGLTLPEPSEPWAGSPRFGVRGLLPWPDFLNCISVYNREDWRAYLEAMLRMRFNTLGIHVYGQEDQWAESFLSFEYGGVGHISFLDTTATDRWGYLPQRTSRYGMSAAQYFDEEVFGADSTRHARGPWEAADMARQAWREAFAYAEQLGIRTGVGFEPYRVPEEIRRAVPPEVRHDEVHNFHGRTHKIERIDPDSRTAKYILESRLAQLLDAYPSVSYVYLWEDEMVNWASQQANVAIPVKPFVQAYEFLRRHAPDKRLVLGGWGGVVRHFPQLHRALPEEIIFTALNDQVGWDPVHPAFGDLGSRERWPIPWLEDDPAMWFPQFHVNRFAQDLGLAEQYGCQGVLGIHWRHRIVDPVAAYMARRFWEPGLDAARYYPAYAATQAAAPRAGALASLLGKADAERTLLATWDGSFLPDGHHTNQGFSGDYCEAFEIETERVIPDSLIAGQQALLAELDDLLADAASPLEQERLGYLVGQIRFVDPYAQAWQAGVALHKLVQAQQAVRKEGKEDQAVRAICEEGVPLYVKLVALTRQAVLSFQHTVATRNDLGMLASVHNKFVRIATFRLRASLLEFLDELPKEAEAAYAAAVGPDLELAGRVIVPTRPTRLAAGECATITAVCPGALEVSEVVLEWRPAGGAAWQAVPMRLVGRRTYAVEFVMPAGPKQVEYRVRAVFAAAPAPLVAVAPPEGGRLAYVVSA